MYKRIFDFHALTCSELADFVFARKTSNIHQMCNGERFDRRDLHEFWHELLIHASNEIQDYK